MSPKRSIYDQAYTAVRNRDLEFAGRLLKQLLSQQPDHLHGWLLASYVMKTRGEAIECLERALKIDPANVHAQQRLAKLQQGTGQTLPDDPDSTLLLHISAERQTVPPEKEPEKETV